MVLSRATTKKGMRRAVGEQSREWHSIEPVTGGCMVRSCAPFFVLCEPYIPSAFRRRHAARPAAGGFRRATTRFGPHPISKRLLTNCYSLCCASSHDKDSPFYAHRIRCHRQRQTEAVPGGGLQTRCACFQTPQASSAI